MKTFKYFIYFKIKQKERKFRIAFNFLIFYYITSIFFGRTALLNTEMAYIFLLFSLNYINMSYFYLIMFDN